MGSDDLEKDIMRQVEDATAHLDQTIEVPTDGTEDEAVASVISGYRNRTGVDLDESEVRAEVRPLRGEAGGGEA
jgi:hypothetical protein